MELRAISAFYLPLAASISHEVRTLSGERPAIKERPNNWDLFLFEIREKHLVIQAVAMQIVYLYNIRLNLVQPGNEFSSAILCARSFFSYNTRIPKTMYFVFTRSSDTERIREICCTLSKCNISIMSSLF